MKSGRMTSRLSEKVRKTNHEHLREDTPLYQRISNIKVSKAHFMRLTILVDPINVLFSQAQVSAEQENTIQQQELVRICQLFLNIR